MKNKKYLVLRTVYLSKKEADKLAVLAFHHKISVNDIIRQMVHDGLKRDQRQNKLTKTVLGR